jgi:hypothetical protein
MGKELVYLDFSGCTSATLPPLIEEAKRLIAARPEKSVCVLTNVIGTELSRTTSQIIKDFATQNKPYVKASAVIGVEGLKKIIYNAVQAVSGRHISSFDTMEQAKDWLAAQ